ncbi:MAG: response regulator [Xanthobacteraceae bacterium]
MINVYAGTDLAPRRLKVLFAEDEVLLRLMLCDVLRESGFQVFEAADAAEAIAILRTTPVDVVITDLHMRVVGYGMEFARHVRAHCPGVSLLLASANERPSYSVPTRAATLSGGAIVGGIVVILIVLGLVLYGVSKIVTDAANNTAASAPQTTDEASRAL